MDDIVSRIILAMKEKGIDQKTLAAEIGVRPQAITEWKKGITASYTRYIQSISNVLGVSADYLLTGQVSEPAPDPELSELVAKFGNLTPEQKAKVIGYMEGLISQR